MSLPLLLLAALLLAATLVDMARLRIPNALPLAIVLLFLGQAWLAGATPWPSQLAAAALMLALGFAAFAGGLLGGGDAKLMAACALWLGLEQLPAFLLLTGLAGGVLALVLAAARRLLAALAARRAAPAPGARIACLRPAAPVPYAGAITIAALLVLIAAPPG